MIKQLIRHNIKLAKQRWGSMLSKATIEALRSYSEQFQFSVASGDILLLENGWYVTNAGLSRLARRNRCAGIDVKPLRQFCDATGQRWAFEARVYKSRLCRGFVGFGDANPSNVSPLVRGAEMRVAETRAVNRALRKAYGIGLCSVEELESSNVPFEKIRTQSSNGNAYENGNGRGSKVRDRLCQLIRQHKLDPGLVKAYAIDYCGTKSLKDAAREQVENFVRELADWAEKDRNGLLCRLNGYAQPKLEEVS